MCNLLGPIQLELVLLERGKPHYVAQITFETVSALKKNPHLVMETKVRINFSGGARRGRTADLYNAIVALSQLSYGPTAIVTFHYIGRVFQFLRAFG